MLGKNRNIKITHAAHIKRHTAGTSNELSFSVLDAAKAAADAETNKIGKPQTPRFGGISLFTLPRRKKNIATPIKDSALPTSDGSASQSDGGSFRSTALSAPKTSRPTYIDPQAEIATRKSRRRKRKGVAIAAVAIVVAALIGGGSLYLHKEATSHEQRVTLLSEAIDLIAQADKPIIAMVEALNQELNEESIERMQEVTANIPEAEAQLTDAEDRINDMGEGFRNSSDQEAVARTLSAIDARRDMISAGKTLMEVSTATHASANLIDAAWADALVADQLARDAAELVSDTTPANVAASKAKSQEASQHFSQALESLKGAEDLMPSVDFAAQRSYLEKRIESAESAIASDDAILAMNREEAVIQNDIYNAADAEAAAMAKLLPEDPAQFIIEEYRESTKTIREAYNTARLSAGTADAFIRDYLGTNGK